jgi:glycosyltransferase involved in cell wall biosynthesis
MIDRRVLQQARTLVEAGYSVDLLAGFDCSEEAEYVENGVRIRRFRFDWSFDPLAKLPFRVRGGRWVRGATRAFVSWVTTGNFDGNAFGAFVFDKGHALEYDVVHVHDLPLLAAGVALAKWRKVPLVFDAHEIYYAQETLPLPARRRLRRMERRYFRQVNLPITVNDAIADYFEALYGKRPLVLLNAAETPAAVPTTTARERLRERAGLPSSAKVVLFQGWMSEERNLLNLVRAVASMPADSALVLIGYGAYEAELRRAAAGQPWENRIRFLGAMENRELAAFTAGADVGVIPYLPIDLNHRLCSPNKFFEYVQSGVPVIAHDLPFFRRMAERYGVVEVGNFESPEGISRAARQLLEDDVGRAAMVERCLRAASVLNWETEAKKLVAAYAELPLDTRQAAAGVGAHHEAHQP